MKHLSHAHELHVESVKLSADNKNTCFGCELPLFGTCYGCSGCKFYLHKFCFQLPQFFQFESHPNHTLGLLYPPYCQGQCDACGGSCNGFTYNCKPCNYNIHANCAALLDVRPKDDPYQYVTAFLWYRSSELKAVRSQLVSESSMIQNNNQAELQKRRHDMHMQQLKRMSDSMDLMGTIGASSNYTYRYY